MCGRRRNARCARRSNVRNVCEYNNYQPRQGLLRAIFTEVMGQREEKRRLMGHSQPQVAWTRQEEPRMSRQISGVAEWGEEKREVREEQRVHKENRRIEVEGPPSYREVMKGT